MRSRNCSRRLAWELLPETNPSCRFGQSMDAPTSDFGDRPIARCNVLGAVPFSEDHDFLNRPYLTESHRKTLDLVRMWMIAAGMSVRLDPLGNLIGRYEGSQANAPALLI